MSHDRDPEQSKSIITCFVRQCFRIRTRMTFEGYIVILRADERFVIDSNFAAAKKEAIVDVKIMT